MGGREGKEPDDYGVGMGPVGHSPVLEERIAALRKGGHALALVARCKGRVEQPPLKADPLVQGRVVGRVDGLLRHGHGRLGEVRNLLGDLDGVVDELGVREDAGNEAVGEGLLGGDGFPGEDHVHGLGLADQAGQALGPAGARNGPELDFGLAKLGRLARQDHVAYHGELAPAAKGPAADSRNDGLADVGDGGPGGQHVGDIGLGEAAALHLLDVGPSRKGPVGARQNHRTDRAVGVKGPGRRRQLGGQGIAQGVQGLGSIEPNQAHAVGRALDQDVLVVSGRQVLERHGGSKGANGAHKTRPRLRLKLVLALLVLELLRFVFELQPSVLGVATILYLLVPELFRLELELALRVFGVPLVLHPLELELLRFVLELLARVLGVTTILYLLVLEFLRLVLELAPLIVRVALALHPLELELLCLVFKLLACVPGVTTILYLLIPDFLGLELELALLIVRIAVVLHPLELELVPLIIRIIVMIRPKTRPKRDWTRPSQRGHPVEADLGQGGRPNVDRREPGRASGDASRGQTNPERNSGQDSEHGTPKKKKKTGSLRGKEKGRTGESGCVQRKGRNERGDVQERCRTDRSGRGNGGRSIQAGRGAQNVEGWSDKSGKGIEEKAWGVGGTPFPNAEPHAPLTPHSPDKPLPRESRVDVPLQLPLWCLSDCRQHILCAPPSDLRVALGSCAPVGPFDRLLFCLVRALFALHTGCVSGVGTGCGTMATRAGSNTVPAAHPDLPARVYAEDGLSSDSAYPPASADPDLWRWHRKNVFLVTRAGKPIYVRYGGATVMEQVSPLLVSLLHKSESVHEGQTLRWLRTRELLIVWLARPDYVAVMLLRDPEPLYWVYQQLWYCVWVLRALAGPRVLDRLRWAPNRYIANDLPEYFSGAMDALLRWLDHDLAGPTGARGILLLEDRDLSSTLVDLVVGAAKRVRPDVGLTSTRGGPLDRFVAVGALTPSPSGVPLSPLLRRPGSVQLPRHSTTLPTSVKSAKTVRRSIATFDHPISIPDIAAPFLSERSEARDSALGSAPRSRSRPSSPTYSVSTESLGPSLKARDLRPGREILWGVLCLGSLALSGLLGSGSKLRVPALAHPDAAEEGDASAGHSAPDGSGSAWPGRADPLAPLTHWHASPSGPVGHPSDLHLVAVLGQAVLVKHAQSGSSTVGSPTGSDSLDQPTAAPGGVDRPESSLSSTLSGLPETPQERSSAPAQPAHGCPQFHQDQSVCFPLTLPHWNPNLILQCSVYPVARLRTPKGQWLADLPNEPGVARLTVPPAPVGVPSSTGQLDSSTGCGPDQGTRLAVQGAVGGGGGPHVAPRPAHHRGAMGPPLAGLAGGQRDPFLTLVVLYPKPELRPYINGFAARVRKQVYGSKILPRVLEALSLGSAYAFSDLQGLEIDQQAWAPPDPLRSPRGLREATQRLSRRAPSPHPLPALPGLLHWVAWHRPATGALPVTYSLPFASDGPYLYRDHAARLLQLYRRLWVALLHNVRGDVVSRTQCTYAAQWLCLGRGAAPRPRAPEGPDVLEGASTQSLAGEGGVQPLGDAPAVASTRGAKDAAGTVHLVSSTDLGQAVAPRLPFAQLLAPPPPMAPVPKPKWARLSSPPKVLPRMPTGAAPSSPAVGSGHEIRRILWRTDYEWVSVSVREGANGARTVVFGAISLLQPVETVSNILVLLLGWATHKLSEAAADDLYFVASI